jgi:hypothetical protein
VEAKRGDIGRVALPEESNVDQSLAVCKTVLAEVNNDWITPGMLSVE